MTTPRQPYGPDDRDAPGRDPRRPGARPTDADDDGTATWGRAPAGGWGVADDGYGEPRYEEPRYREPGYGETSYGEPGYGEPRYGEPGYGEPRYGEPGFVEPAYGEPRYGEPGYREPAYGEPGYVEPRYGDPPGRSRPEAARRRGAARRGARPREKDRDEPPLGQGLSVTPHRASRRRRRPPRVALAAVGVVVVAVLVLGFVVPGWFVTRVLDAAAVQTGVAKILSDSYGVDGVGDVHCPEGVQVTAGATFTCDATIDGDPVKVPIKVTDGRGGYEVGRPS